MTVARPFALARFALPCALLIACSGSSVEGEPSPDAGGGKTDDTAETAQVPERVEITLAAQLGLEAQIVAEVRAVSSTGQTVSLPAGVTPEWKSDKPDIARVEGSGTSATVHGVSLGEAQISVEVGALTAARALVVVEATGGGGGGDVRESYNGEPCDDYAVSGRDVWACAVIGDEQPAYEGQNMLQVCRDGTWQSAYPMTQDECDSCGYDGVETAPGALCEDAPACAVDYYCAD